MEDESPLMKPLKPEGEKELPWFDRTQLAGLTNFLAMDLKQDPFMVILTDQVVYDLLKGTNEHYPLEAYGQLMGKTCKDRYGYFTIVSSVVYAVDLDASRGHFKLSDIQMREVRKLATRKYPEADFVGWTHSHPGVSYYSAVDLEEQKTWTKDYNVGILTFMSFNNGDPWAFAYHGPDSRQLYMPRTQYVPPPKNIPSPRKHSSNSSDSLLFKPKGLEVAPPKPDEVPAPSAEQKVTNGEVEPGTSKRHASRHFNKLYLVALLVILGVLLFMLFLLFFLHSLDVRVGALQNRLARQTEVLVFPASTSLPWNCETESASLLVICNGPVGPNISGWIWNFGDGSSVQNSVTNSIAYSYKHPGTYTVKLTISTSYGKEETGSATLTVTAPPTPTPTLTPVK